MMGEVMREAAFTMAEAKFAMGDFNSLVLQNTDKAQLKVKSRRDNVAGRSSSVAICVVNTVLKVVIVETVKISLN